MIAVNPSPEGLFERLTAEIVKAGMEAHVNVVEKICDRRICNSEGWDNPDKWPEVESFIVTDQPPLEALRLQRKLTHQDSEENPFSAEPGSLKFMTQLQPGTPFPGVKNLYWLSSQQPIELSHQPGEVLLTIFWDGSQILEHFQTMFLKLHQLEDGRLRLTAISNCEDTHEAMEVIFDRRLCLFEHFSFLEKYHPQDLSTALPFIVLVDQNGVVVEVATGANPGSGWQGKVQELLAGTYSRQKRNREDSDRTTRLFGEETLTKFENFTKVVPKLSESALIEVAIYSTRTFSNGLVTINVEPIDILLNFSQTSEISLEEILQQVEEYFDKCEYRLFISGNKELELRNEYNKIAEALLAIGIKERPTIVSQSQIAIKQFYAVEHVSIVLPIPNHREEIKERLDGVLRQAIRGTGGVNYCSSLRYEHDPEYYRGLQFQGIHELFDLKGRPASPIVPIAGVTQVIAFYLHGGDRLGQRNIWNLERQLSLYTDTSILHVICPKGLDVLAMGLFGHCLPTIKLYVTDISPNKGIQFFFDVQEMSRNRIVINSSGRIAFYGQLDKYYPQLEQVLRGDKHEIVRPNPILASEQTAQAAIILKSKELEVEDSLEWVEYNTRLKVVFDELRSDPTSSRTVSVPKVHGILRETNQGLLKPFRDYFPQVEFDVSIVRTVELPLGEFCEDCKECLKLPYFYFFVSKVHRCVACTQRTDTSTEERLLKYPHKENSVLLFHDRVVDVDMLGWNMQPREEHECGDHAFICDNCGRRPTNEPRYICIGCCRQPHDDDYVDFCSSCVNTMLVGFQEQQLPTLRARKRRKHQNTHPLLRVLFQLISYYEY